MTFIREFARDCRTVVIPLVVVICLTLLLALIGLWDAAKIVSNIGTLLVLFANVIYLAVKKS
jgi:hypothetical protein